MIEGERITIPVSEFYEKYYLPSMNMDKEIVDTLSMLNLQARANNDDNVVMERWLYDLVIENKQKTGQMNNLQKVSIESGATTPNEQPNSEAAKGCLSGIGLIIAIICIIGGIVGFITTCS